jgi:hypothetical protein
VDEEDVDEAEEAALLGVAFSRLAALVLTELQSVSTEAQESQEKTFRNRLASA